MLLPIILFIGSGTLSPADIGENVRSYTRAVEFDYVSWTLDALGIKASQATQGGSQYIAEDEASQMVRDYRDLIHMIQVGEAQLEILHADPETASLAAEISELQEILAAHYVEREAKAPLVEAIMQKQLAQILEEFKLTWLGQAIPPVLFHSTPLPWALIVSPRDNIRQEANISLQTEFSLADQIDLEYEVSSALQVSTLVVPVGGIGSYPTMIAQSSNLNWLAEVIAHEWIHNYLTLRPLGLLYERDQELRTMNETAANIAGKELAAALIKGFYPELQPPAAAPQAEQSGLLPELQIEAIPIFDFRAEMHSTRVQVDALLAAGEIEQAESYMELRRLFFWEKGFPIRKLNQAYFAFYGSYADHPQGPAGEDPVGAAVRQLRSLSPTLKSFLGRMAFLTSFDALERTLEE